MKSVLSTPFKLATILIGSACYSQNVSINTTGTAGATTNMLEVSTSSATTTSTAINAIHTGANASGTGYAFQAVKTGAGASSTNVAGYFSASGATNNYAIIIPSTGGRVGIGTTSPQNILDVEAGMVVGATYSGTNTAPTNGMLIQGNVAIGTTSASSPLHVNGAIRTGLASSTNGSIVLNNSSNANTVTINTGTTSSSYSVNLPAAQGGANTALINDGSGGLSWSSVGGGAPAYNSTSDIFDDFMDGGGSILSSGERFGALNWSQAYGSQSLIYSSTPVANHPGNLELRVSNSTAYNTVYLGNNFVGNQGGITMTAIIRETNASGAAGSVNDFDRRLGLAQYHTTADPANGYYFRTIANGNWFAITRSASSETATDTGVTPSAGTWRTFQIITNAAGTSITFYINGALVATHGTNIPASGITDIKPIFNLSTGGGTHATANQGYWVDFFRLQMSLTR